MSKEKLNKLMNDSWSYHNHSSGGSGLPEGGDPHQQLVTDVNGVAVWEDRSHYKRDRVVARFNHNAAEDPAVSPYVVSDYDADCDPQVRAQLKAIADSIYSFYGKYKYLVFYWNGVRIEGGHQRFPIVLDRTSDLGVSITFSVQALNDEPYGPHLAVRFTEPGDHVLEYELWEPELKKLDPVFLPIPEVNILLADDGYTPLCDTPYAIVKEMLVTGKPFRTNVMMATIYTDSSTGKTCGNITYSLVNSVDIIYYDGRECIRFDINCFAAGESEQTTYNYYSLYFYPDDTMTEKWTT